MEGSPIQLREWTPRQRVGLGSQTGLGGEADARAKREREHELAKRAAGGDGAAQTALVQLLMPRVRQITRAFLREGSDADDAAQLSLLAILRSVPSFRGDSSLAHWAKRIAVRTTMRHLERERRCRRPLVSEDGERLVSEPLERGGEGLPRELSEYLDELPDLQRDAIVLHHALGYSIAEIAETTGVSPNTVKGRLRLGSTTLRRRVRQEVLIGRRRDNERR